MLHDTDSTGKMSGSCSGAVKRSVEPLTAPAERARNGGSAPEARLTGGAKPAGLTEYQAEESTLIDNTQHANGQPAEQAEVVQPQKDAQEAEPPEGASSLTAPAEPVQPQDRAWEMSEEAFREYIESAKNGEVQAAGSTDSLQKERQDAQAAADGQKEENGENPTESLQNEEKPEPFMQFATEAELQAYQDKTIGNRIRQLREQYAPAKEKLEQVFSVAKDFYAIEDQEEALKTLLTDLQAQSADKKGMPVEEMIRQQTLERDAMAYRKQQRAEQEQKQAVSQIYTDWERQAGHLRQIVPDFDLKTAFQNSEFYKKVVGGGYSLSEAYMAVQWNPGGAATARTGRFSAQGTSQPEAVQKRFVQRRPIQEAGAQNTAVAGKIRQDVGAMTDGEFLTYIRRIQNG